MTKKDYELIAKVLKREYEEKKGLNIVQEMAISRLIFHLADALFWDNKKFNHEKFLNACGVTK